jgi:hypothetical protein
MCRSGSVGYHYTTAVCMSYVLYTGEWGYLPVRSIINPKPLSRLTSRRSSRALHRNITTYRSQGYSQVATVLYCSSNFTCEGKGRLLFYTRLKC